MTDRLRRIFGAAICAFVGVVMCSHAMAQAYPSKPVRFVVPYPAGGPFDEVARTIGPRLTAIWGQQVLVDNRSGAGGSIGADVVAKWPADGGAGSARLGAWMRPGSGL